jgi:XTP/dITP diphosphohydrolase
MVKEILIATTNKGKIVELIPLLKASPFFKNYNFISLSDMGEIEPPAEIFESFEENALLKANFYFSAFHMPVICEDSGFCVNELGGIPGVHSADWGKNGDFTEGIKKVYEMLEGRPSLASFKCVVIFKTKTDFIKGEGEVKGVLPPSAIGKGGFGFDPCFIPEGETRTFSQMSLEEKLLFSHRKEAIKNLLTKL